MAKLVLSHLLDILTSSPLAAEIKLGPERIGARTDGGLQIFLPCNDSLIAWDRSYYEIALEVNIFIIINLGQTFSPNQT